MNASQERFSLEIQPENPNLIFRWTRDGISCHKEIRQEAFISCFRQALKAPPVFTGLLPANCVSYAKRPDGLEQVAICVEPSFADIAYHDTTYQHFPMPRLLYRFSFVRGHRIQGVKLAVLDKGYLRPASRLFYYPFSNVAQSGALCTGSNVLPKCESLHSLASLPMYIMSMKNNDDHFSTDRNKENLPYRTLLERMKNKSPEDYYTNVLVLRKETLGEFLEQ